MHDKHAGNGKADKADKTRGKGYSVEPPPPLQPWGYISSARGMPPKFSQIFENLTKNYVCDDPQNAQKSPLKN